MYPEHNPILSGGGGEGQDCEGPGFERISGKKLNAGYDNRGKSLMLYIFI